MKKIFKKLFGFFAALLLVFTLTSCDTSSSIKKSYEKAGYEVSSTKYEDLSSTAKNILESVLDENQKEEIANYEIIFCSKGLLDYAIIIKFPSSSDLKNFLVTETEDGKNTAAYDSAKEKGRINGNCLLISGTAEPFK